VTPKEQALTPHLAQPCLETVCLRIIAACRPLIYSAVLRPPMAPSHHGSTMYDCGGDEGKDGSIGRAAESVLLCKLLAWHYHLHGPPLNRALFGNHYWRSKLGVPCRWPP